MRIGICINQAWNIYNFRQGLIAALLAEGHEVVAIAPPDPQHEALLQGLGCAFVPVEMAQKGSNPLQDLALMQRLRKAYRQARLQAVLHFTIKPNIYGTMAARSLGIPCISNVTGLGTVFIRQNATARIAHALYRIAFRFPLRIFFQNPDDQQLFAELGLASAARTALIPGSGVDLERFQPRPAQNRLPGPFRFLMVARLIYDKGLLEYVEASRLLRARGVPVVCQLLGKVEPDAGLGVDAAQVAAWEAEGLVQYLGTAPDVRPVIEQADCVVLPSYREGTPRTLLEAASMAKPLIATDVPGCREPVQPEVNGLLCEVKNPASLAEAMGKMASLSVDRLREMGLASRHLAETRFDERLVIQAYRDALDLIRGAG